ncbi:hypothetical protein Pmani_024677 [Petrolisthes manimaculis]|uniref:alpha-glucosidase n=1 Tax=Petrolisthes manimaculis TaxID=1843537 RepID=A0AAE1P9U8_9EUCA|nr:hypothetical protein Pmani_024677 [Petrolisthes manimaculis]
MNRKIIFTTLFTLLFVGVIVVIVVCFIAKNGKRVEEEVLPFWKTEIIYQVYPRSFFDGVPDGTGDLAGISSRMEYLTHLGIGVVWLNPVFQSPMKDFGYDISNYTDIDPIFGTMDDLDHLIAEVHRHGLKILLDFVPNHSSDQHEWFIKSVNREDPYTNYYVWSDGKVLANDTRVPPNNWVSKFRGSAWEYNEKRGQYYYHQYLKEQPDLNYRSPNLKEEMKNVLTFWLKKGVDGFRIDALVSLFEVEDLNLDEPVASDSDTDDPNDHAYLNHTYTLNQPETFEVLAEWRHLVDKYPNKVLITEVYTAVEDVMRYYGNDTVPLADFSFNYFLQDSLMNRSELTGDSLKQTVNLWLDNLPPNKWPNWVLGNHDNGRVASRVGKDLVDALNMLNLLLPGTPTTYYGEELGMENTFISWEDTRDPKGCRWGKEHYQEYSRDPERTPMQWNKTSLAGFTTASDTWLPVNPNYEYLNVLAQEEAEVSHLKVYRSLAELRKTQTFIKGEIAFPFTSKEIFSFTRTLEGSEEYLVVINTAVEEVEVNLHQNSNFELPEHGTVVLRSITDTSQHSEIGSVVNLAELLLVPAQGDYQHLVILAVVEDDICN